VHHLKGKKRRKASDPLIQDLGQKKGKERRIPRVDGQGGKGVFFAHDRKKDQKGRRDGKRTPPFRTSISRGKEAGCPVEPCREEKGKRRKNRGSLVVLKRERAMIDSREKERERERKARSSITSAVRGRRWRFPDGRREGEKGEGGLTLYSFMRNKGGRLSHFSAR